MVVAAAAVASCSWIACGTNVDLGGTADAGEADGSQSAEELVDVCEPCATPSACPMGATCVQIAGKNTFCATVCPSAAECDGDDTCELVRTTTAETIRACVPKVGACAPAKAPVVDSSVVDRCGGLDGPTLASVCRSCDSDDQGCQRNGCYGGWWCNTTLQRCERPPATCPS
ncbi:MAG: hypothetical protein JWP87_4548 [Labilithrix sp.]|nr:hypothetical protein [Labilithrix sp.]